MRRIRNSENNVKIEVYNDKGAKILQVRVKNK
ncbi:hypothetical protein CLOBL_02480 [Clostridium sp. BL-8]|nr:hypothetical protein CLOBL_02480 [Clostridium sp. BL-8]